MGGRWYYRKKATVEQSCDLSIFRLNKAGMLTGRRSMDIMQRMAGDAETGGDDGEEAKMIITLHHTLQRLIKPRAVTIPYAKRLVSVFPPKRVEARRAFKSMLTLISVSALLHQFQRDEDEHGRIVASGTDYEVVRKYLASAVAVGLGHTLTPGAHRILERIESEYTLGDDDLFTVHDIADHLDASTKTVYPKISELLERGFIILVEPAQGPKPGQHRRAAYPKGKIDFELPPFENVVAGIPEETEKQGAQNSLSS